jgi:CHAD domain-containing protein
MVTVHLEVEKKYDADDDFELPPLLQLAAGADALQTGSVASAVEGETVTQRLGATYFDTADLRLAAAGLTLRRRTGGDDAGWHLKVPAGKGARSEVHLPLGRGTKTVPPPLQRMVWARSLGAALRPIAEIMTDRSVRRIVDATGHVLAEIADDRVTARRLLSTDGLGTAAGAATTWREIEVELGDGDEELLETVDTRLREHGLREASSGSKLARVLDLPRRGAAAPGPTEELTVESAGGDTIMAHVREQVEQIRAQDLPVRLEGPDAVHKMRVATRRLRSALTTFKPLFAAEGTGPLRDELKWLAGELGAARDAEVMRDRVRQAVEAEADAVELGPVADVAAAELDGVHRTAYDRVLAELDGDRYHELLLALDRLLATPPLTKKARRATGKVLPKLVARSYSNVRALVEEAAATSAEAEREELLHDARKAAKQARYAGESVGVAFGKDALTFAAAMEGVQEALGEYQDSILTRERLMELALHTPSTAAAFLYGRLHALEGAHAELSKQHFDTAWKDAGRKSVHRWLR